MAWEENPRICLHMQLIAILSRTGVIITDLHLQMYDKNLIFPSFHRVHLVCKWWKASICGTMGVHLALLFIIIAIAG